MGRGMEKKWGGKGTGVEGRGREAGGKGRGGDERGSQTPQIFR